MKNRVETEWPKTEQSRQKNKKLLYEKTFFPKNNRIWM